MNLDVIPSVCGPAHDAAMSKPPCGEDPLLAPRFETAVQRTKSRSFTAFRMTVERAAAEKAKRTLDHPTFILE